MKKYVTDLIEKTPVAGSEVALPSTGTVNLFINSEDDNSLSVMNDAGEISRVTPLETDFDIKNLTDSTSLKTAWSDKQDALIVNGYGDFVLIDAQADSRNWYGMTTGMNGDIYACVYGGRIYKQIGGVGDFILIDEQADNRNWYGMTTGLNGDVYASTNFTISPLLPGRIYKQAEGSGDFTLIAEQTISRTWRGMTTGLNGDVYACVYNGRIYKQIGGSGDFVIIDEQTDSRKWMGMTTGLNGDVYASVYDGRIYKQIGGVGDFVLIDAQADSRKWMGMTTGLNGDIYASVYGGRIYKTIETISQIFTDYTLFAKEFVNVNSGTITRDIDGEIETVAITDGRTLTISRNVDGTIDTVSDGTRTWTFTYTDGLLTSWSVGEI